MNVKITLNGEEKTVAAGTTLDELVASLRLNSQKVAMERNLEIVPRSVYKETTLEAGDRVEIVHFVGGG